MLWRSNRGRVKGVSPPPPLEKILRMQEGRSFIVSLKSPLNPQAEHLPKPLGRTTTRLVNKSSKVWGLYIFKVLRRNHDGRGEGRKLGSWSYTIPIKTTRAGNGEQKLMHYQTIWFYLGLIPSMQNLGEFSYLVQYATSTRTDPVLILDCPPTHPTSFLASAHAERRPFCSSRRRVFGSSAHLQCRNFRLVTRRNHVSRIGLSERLLGISFSSCVKQYFWKWCSKDSSR